MNATWNAYGVSGQGSLQNVLCNDKTGRLIAHFKKNGTAGTVSSLFSRSLTSAQYERLTPEDDTRTFEDPISSATSPYVYTNVFRIQPHPKEKTASVLTWEELIRVNLETKQRETLLTETDLATEISGKRPYVSQILGCSNTGGESIILSIAWQHRSDKGQHAEYWVYRMTLDTKKLAKLGQLYDTGI
ncbi:MAG: hypothetical protein ACJ8NR_03200 [Sulfurifustis sp.]